MFDVFDAIIITASWVIDQEVLACVEVASECARIGAAALVFRYFRLKKDLESLPVTPGSLSGGFLLREATTPIAIQQLNNLPEKTRQRIYRGLISPGLLARFQIDPISWEARNGGCEISLQAAPETLLVKLAIRDPSSQSDEFVALEIQDNAFAGIDLNWIVLGDPGSPRYEIDRDPDGKATYYGTVGRNLGAEEAAMRAGLAPGQVRLGLGSSQAVIDTLETFLATLGQRAYFLEPLTYASAWLFEKRGFAYVRGHKLMQDIQREFQPGGRLHRALDGSSPFRRPEQGGTVRGRAWAIQDGILEAIEARWDKIRMVKQIGQHAGTQTFPNAVY